jgi:hypothetical protein
LTSSTPALPRFGLVARLGAAHGVSNAPLALYVLLFDQWQLG